MGQLFSGRFLSGHIRPDRSPLKGRWRRAAHNRRVATRTPRWPAACQVRYRAAPLQSSLLLVGFGVEGWRPSAVRALLAPVGGLVVFLRDGRGDTAPPQVAAV